ncbi:MAG: hypothetical protein V7740_18235 [Pseudomonas marincola]
MAVKKIGLTFGALLFILMFLVFASQTFMSGDCDYIDETIISRISKNYNGLIEIEQPRSEALTLTTAEFQSLLEKSKQTAYPLDIHVNDFYKFDIRRHFGGSCDPFSITGLTKAEIPNVMLYPTAFHAYGGSFVLAEAKGCSQQDFPNSCVNDLALDPSFNSEDLRYLTSIKPRSVGYCSAKTMMSIWPDIEPALDLKHVLACVESIHGEERAIEFSVPETGERRILLRKIYAETWSK